MKTPPFPPGPSALAGAAFAFTRGRNFAGVAAFFFKVARRYGPVVHWRVGPRHFYLLDEPALIEELLVTRSRDFAKGAALQRLKLLIEDGLLTSEPPLHLRQRRMMQPAFHRDRVADYGTQMVAYTRERGAAWRPDESLNIDAEMAALTLDIIAATMFGGASAQDAQEVRQALRDLQGGFTMSLGAVSQFLPNRLVDTLMHRFSKVPRIRKTLDARARLDEVVYRIIDERIASDTESNDDLLSMLLAAREDDGQGMSLRQIHDELMTIFLAGHETTAIALTWTWYLLAQHPEVESKLYAEVVRVLGDREANVADVADLSYVRDVVAESLRLYPSAWNMTRRAIRDTQLGEWTIPKGATVFASQLVTHRNPRFWSDPESFRPERWSAPDRALPKFAYFPFGGGNRVCIGESFAWMEAVLIVATLARNWRFELVDPMPVPIAPVITLRPERSIAMRARHR